MTDLLPCPDNCRRCGAKFPKPNWGREGYGTGYEPYLCGACGEEHPIWSGPRHVILDGDLLWCGRLRGRLPTSWFSVTSGRPDLGILVRCGRIMKSPEIALPVHGFLNLHLGRLPDYRGVRPISRALLAGDDAITATWHRVDRGIDTGPIVLETEIPTRDLDAADLFPLAMEAGFAALVAAADRLPALVRHAHRQPSRGRLVTSRTWRRATAWR